MNLEQELADCRSSPSEQKKQTLFEKIYGQYYKLVWFCAFRFLGNREDTEEISDDVFVGFYFRMDKTEIGNIKYYLTRSARNLSLNRLRTRRPTEELNENTGGEYFFSAGSGLLEEVERLTTKEQIELLHRHVLEGYSLSEIAQQRGESLNTVKSRYRRLITELRSVLGDFYDESFG